MKIQGTKKMIKSVAILFALLLVMASTLACVPRVYAQGCGGEIAANGKFVYDTWFFGVIPWNSSARMAGGCQYTFYGTAGQSVTISMQRDDYSPGLNPYLELSAPPLRDQTVGTIVARNDDVSSIDTNSSIESYQLPSTGIYTISARSYKNASYGKFWLYVSLY